MFIYVCAYIAYRALWLVVGLGFHLASNFAARRKEKREMQKQLADRRWLENAKVGSSGFRPSTPEEDQEFLNALAKYRNEKANRDKSGH